VEQQGKDIPTVGEEDRVGILAVQDGMACHLGVVDIPKENDGPLVPPVPGHLEGVTGTDTVRARGLVVEKGTGEHLSCPVDQWFPIELEPILGDSFETIRGTSGQDND